MRTTTYSTQLRHSADVVYAFLADLLNDAKWRDEVLRTKVVSGSPGEVGTTYRETLTWEGLRAPAALTVKEGVEASRLVVVATDPGYEAVYEFTFEPRGDGTSLTLQITIATVGALMLVEPFLEAMISRWFERGLQRIDRAIDNS